jgi:hypothetical protein
MIKFPDGTNEEVEIMAIRLTYASKAKLHYSGDSQRYIII